jgi:hypothetical protein
MTSDGAKENKRGQAMILAVLALGGTILGATTVAGFLTLYQLREATNFEASSKSIFTADAGTEWALYNYYHGATAMADDCPLAIANGAPSPSQTCTFSNGATVQVTCSDSNNSPTSCNASSTAVSAIAKGSAGNTKRAFSLYFAGSNFTYP